MKLERVVSLPAGSATVWQAISDVKTLAECIPGVEVLGRNDGGDYCGSITFKTGPKAVRFEGTVKFKLDETTRSGELEATGSDRRQASRAKARLAFAVAERDGESELSLNGDVTFVGALAEFAESGGIYVGEQLMDAFAAELDQRTAARGGRSPAGVAAPEEQGATPVAGAAPAAPIRIQLFALIRTALRGLWQRHKGASTTISRGDKTGDEGS